MALYARVSSESQAHTIQSQLAALQDRIAQDGGGLIPEHEFVEEGYSGATLIRPALERLRDAGAAGEVQRLYVHSPDRLARQYAYPVMRVAELQRAGVERVFLHRELGQSPEDELWLQVQGMIAEYERAKRLERSRRGKRHQAQPGSVNGLCGAPDGYRSIPLAEGSGQARYKLIDGEAQGVRQIFEWIGRERLSIGEGQRRLLAAGIPSPRGQGGWDRSSIWGMLKNPAQVGQAALGKTRVGALRSRRRASRGGNLPPRRARSTYDTLPEQWLSIPVPAVVSEELFAAVQAQRQENRRRARCGPRGARYLRQGLWVCSCCGDA